MSHRHESRVRAHGARERRWSDVVPVCATRALCAMARELHDRGDDEAAREAALDALVAWSLEPGTVDADELVELLEDVCGAQSRAILDTVLAAGALAAATSPG